MVEDAQNKEVSNVTPEKENFLVLSSFLCADVTLLIWEVSFTIGFFIYFSYNRRHNILIFN